MELRLKDSKQLKQVQTAVRAMIATRAQEQPQMAIMPPCATEDMVGSSTPGSVVAASSLPSVRRSVGRYGRLDRPASKPRLSQYCDEDQFHDDGIETAAPPGAGARDTCDDEPERLRSLLQSSHVVPPAGGAVGVAGCLPVSGDGTATGEDGAASGAADGVGLEASAQWDSGAVAKAPPWLSFASPSTRGSPPCKAVCPGGSGVLTRIA